MPEVFAEEALQLTVGSRKAIAQMRDPALGPVMLRGKKRQADQQKYDSRQHRKDKPCDPEHNE